MHVLTVGGAMIDTIAIISSDRIERMSMCNADSSFLLLAEGHKTEAESISTHCGGGAVNAAVAMARLGLDVATLIKLGVDQRAEDMLARLAAEGIATDWVRRDPRAPTGASVMIASHDRNAAIFTFRGVNTLFEEADLVDEAFAAEVVYVTNLSNKSAEQFPAIVKKARAHGALVATNPGLRQLSARGRAFLDCLGMVDILTLNRTEAAALVPGLAALGPAGQTPSLVSPTPEAVPPLVFKDITGGGFGMGVVEFLCALTRLGPRYVVMTDGARGALAGTAERISYCPAAECPVVGTAGAGDAFASTFTGAVALGWPMEAALRAAAVNAASVVGYVDTQSGLLRTEAMQTALAGHAATLAVRSWPLAC